MKNLKQNILLMVFVGMLAGCGSPKDASESNFKSVINKYLENSCIMISLYDNRFPVTINVSPSGSYVVASPSSASIKQYEALVGIGMLDEKEGSTQVDERFFGRGMKTVKTKEYSLTDKGKAAFNDNGGSYIGSKQGFCVAKYQVSDILNFSEPSQMMGYTISNVNYTFSPKNIATWATKEAITKAFPQLVTVLEKNQKESATLVLMNDGWVHERNMSN